MMVVQCVFSSMCMAQEAKMEGLMKLTKWERGVKVESRRDKMGFAYFWFYEWHLFDAVSKGEHTHGTHSWKWTVDANGTLAQMNSQWLKMRIKATENGADIALDITNTTNYDWPDIAAMIPCFNPGDHGNREEQNLIFLDEKHEHTYFVGNNRLELIKGQYPREIHFNHKFRTTIMNWKKERDDGNFVFSDKWPTSDRDAYSGLIIRESDDKQWVMGIAWESFISAQGHNPWKCMHLSVRVGPLKQGEKKTIRGRIYLFKGSKEDCLRYFKKDFSNETNGTVAQQADPADANKPRY
ncbi:MAG: hypothetical protein ACYTBX_10065 [Planctomycetota bacterium]